MPDPSSVPPEEVEAEVQRQLQTEAERREAKALAEQGHQEAQKISPFSEMPGEADPEELRRREEESRSDIPLPGDEPAQTYLVGPDGKFFNQDGTAAPEDAITGVTTAFIIILERSGRIWATTDLGFVERMKIDRLASEHDIIPACAAVTADLQMMKTVSNTVNAVMQTSAAMAEQERISRMQQALANKGVQPPRRR